jgi:AcrR family transcriptional regulator
MSASRTSARAKRSSQLSKPVRKRRRLTKGDRSKVALEDAARKVIRRIGFLNLKIADITEEAGMAIGSFYNYYDDKDDLLRSMVDDVVRQVETYQLALAPSGVDQIGSALRAFWQLYGANLEALVSVYQASIVDARYLKIWRRIQRLGIDAHANRIKAAQAQGYCPGLDPELTGAAFQAMVERMYYLKHFVEPSMERKNVTDSEEVLDTLHTLIYRGIMWK